jgi:diguanylate cyclase (GGDEF)-like protein/PAS domain S-box-containing protein
MEARNEESSVSQRPEADVVPATGREPPLEQVLHLLEMTGHAEPSGDEVTALARLLFATLDALTHSLYIIDASNFHVVLANRSSQLQPPRQGLTCYSATHGLQRPCGEYGLGCPLREVVESRKPATAEHLHLDPSGAARVCEVHSYPIFGASGEVTHVVEYNLDVTEQRTSQEQLRLLGTAIESAANAIFVTDHDAHVTWINEAFSRLSGYSRDEVIGRRPSLWKSGLHDDLFYDSMWKTVLSGRVWRGRVVNRHKSGSLFIVEQTITPLTDRDGKISNFVVVHEDITARERAERQAERASRLDPLTGLPNRLTFSELVDRALNESGRTGRGVSVLMIDLDHFRAINETFGRGLGDAVLLAVEKRLREVVRRADSLGRTGSDEFAVLQNAACPVNVGQLAERLLSVFDAPFAVGDRELRVSATIGVSAPGVVDSETALKQAEIALYRAKRDNLSSFSIYDPEVDDQSRRQLALAFDLRSALARNELFLEFQPQIEIRSRRIVGAEALLRWQHPTRGLVRPLDFIEIAERMGMSACREATRWARETGVAIPLAVNISANELRGASFVGIVRRAVLGCDFSPQNLELEVTEWALLQDSDVVARNLRELCDLGIGIAIDDFGAGYSSFESLRRHTVRTLKVPQRFVASMCSAARDHAIVATLVDLARRLALRHVVEGVETREQLRLLIEAGCQVAQGFLLGRPMPATDLAELVRT